MKKFLMVLIASIFVADAFAQDESKGAEFNCNLEGFAFGVAGTYGGDTKWDYQHIRLRPAFSLGNENIKGVVRFEIDYDYGDPNVPAKNGSGGNPYAAAVNLAYLELTDPFNLGLTFTTGINEYAYPLITDNEFDFTGLTCDFGMGSASLIYVKLEEGLFSKNPADNIDKNQDLQVYILDVTIKAGDIEVRPALFFANAGKGWAIDGRDFDDINGNDDGNGFVTRDLKVYMGALNATADMSMFEFEVTAAYLKMKKKVDEYTTGTSGGPYGTLYDVAKFNQSGYAFDINVNIKPNTDIEIGLFGTYASGSSGGKKIAFLPTVDDILGDAPVGKLLLLQSAGNQENGGLEMGEIGIDGGRLSEYGNITFGLSAKYTLWDKLTLTAQYGYMISAKKNAQGNKNIGQEVDAIISYEVAPKTDLLLECGYVIKGDDGFLVDDARQILWGLTTSI